MYKTSLSSKCAPIGLRPGWRVYLLFLPTCYWYKYILILLEWKYISTFSNSDLFLRHSLSRLLSICIIWQNFLCERALVSPWPRWVSCNSYAQTTLNLSLMVYFFLTFEGIFSILWMWCALLTLPSESCLEWNRESIIQWTNRRMKQNENKRMTPNTTHWQYRTWESNV